MEVVAVVYFRQPTTIDKVVSDGGVSEATAFVKTNQGSQFLDVYVRIVDHVFVGRFRAGANLPHPQ